MSGYTTRLCGFTAHSLPLRSYRSFLVQTKPDTTGLRKFSNEVPPEHRHSRAGRLGVLTECVAGSCLDDGQLTDSSQ